MKNIVYILTLILVILLGMLAFSGDRDTREHETGPIKIGASLPLTGEAASFGEFLMGGLELAVKEVNDAGGVDGREIKLIVEDDMCSDSSVSAVNKLVNIDKVTAIVGSICSAAVGPSAPIAQEAGVPMIVWGSAPPLTRVGDYIFRTYPSDSLQGVFAANFIYNNLGKRKAAIVYTNNDWGVGLYEVFKKTFSDLGGTVVLEEGVSQDTTDLRTSFSKVKFANPDVVYLLTYPQGGILAVKQIKEQGIDAMVVAGDAFSSEETLSVPESEGVLFTQARTEFPDEFKNRVMEATGRDTNFISSFAYDSIKILAQIIAKVGTDKEAIRDALEDLEYTDSIATPSVVFDEYGDIEFSEFDVKIISGGLAENYTLE